MKICKQ